MIACDSQNYMYGPSDQLCTCTHDMIHNTIYALNNFCTYLLG